MKPKLHFFIIKLFRQKAQLKGLFMKLSLVIFNNLENKERKNLLRIIVNYVGIKENLLWIMSGHSIIQIIY